MDMATGFSVTFYDADCVSMDLSVFPAPGQPDASLGEHAPPPPFPDAPTSHGVEDTLASEDRVGGGYVAIPAVLPHRRTYGSVSGDSVGLRFVQDP